MGQANFDINAVNAELQEAAVKDTGFFDLPEEIVVGAGDWVDDIYVMHTKFGVREVVQKFDKEKLLKFLQFRLNFLQEELDEAKFAHATLVSTMGVDGEAARLNELGAADDIVDAMIDLCVVAIGTLDALQVDAYEAWNRVLAANLEKEPGVKPERPNPLGLPDLIKPAGWTAPTHTDNIGLLGAL